MKIAKLIKFSPEEIAMIRAIASARPDIKLNETAIIKAAISEMYAKIKRA